MGWRRRHCWPSFPTVPTPGFSLFLPSVGADCGCWGHVDPTGGPVREHRLHSAPAGSSGSHKEQPHLYCLHHRWGTWRHLDAFFSLHGACLLSTSAEPWPGRSLLKTLSFLFLPSIFPRLCQKIPTTEMIMETSAQSVVHVDQLRAPSRDVSLLLIPNFVPVSLQKVFFLSLSFPWCLSSVALLVSVTAETFSTELHTPSHFCKHKVLLCIQCLTQSFKPPLMPF